MITRLKLLGSRLKVVDCLLKFARDAYSKDPNPEHWRTISGAKVHLTNGKIDGGAGGKFNGKVYTGKKNKISRAEQETWHKNSEGNNGGKSNNPSGTQKTVSPNYRPVSLAGVARREPMTREKANGGSVNPKYKKGSAYATNCQTCVVAFEARLRGYNVTAGSYRDGSNFELLAKKTNLAWIDPNTGTHPEPLQDKNVKNAKQCGKWLESIIEKDKRYTIDFCWKGRDQGGHIVNLRRNENNELEIYDPQVNEYYTGSALRKYLGEIKYERSFHGYKFSSAPKVLRVDHLDFNVDFVNKIFEKGEENDD